ncbi:hypothetical protein LCL89_13425 [Halobacillus yeomjeoni]|uniref:hypothetical protein n=1 Tax=Halobacillus yeomjeoni TaxID=311194 RepID=UPI001CD365D4|nr:hypothetical protein [Halobacillus yeomjeoni]MCA0985039.1 hypothetical protein [Halobacillus yeomjeoni]
MTVKKKWQWGSIALILLLLAAGTYISTSERNGKLTFSEDYKPMRKAKAVDKEELPASWREVSSKEDVESFYKKAVPGYSLAREQEVMTSPNVSARIQNRDGRVQINNVWHTGKRIYLFYSIDLSALIEENENSRMQPIPMLESLVWNETNNNDRKSMHGRIVHQPKGMLFNNRLYTVARVVPAHKPLDEVSQDQWEPFEPFNQTIPTTMNLNIGGKVYSSDSVAVQYQYQPVDHKLKEYEFTGTYETDKIRLKPLSLSLGLDKTTLMVKVEGDSKKSIQAIEGDLLGADGERLPVVPYLKPVPERKNVYEMTIHDSFSKVPDEVELRVARIQFRGDTSYTFNLDLSDYDLEERYIHVNKTVVEVEGTNVKLNKISNDPSNRFGVHLTYEPENHDQDIILSGFPSPSEQKNGYPAETIHITSDNGKSDSSPPSVSWGNHTKLDVKPKLIEDAENIQIKVTDVSYSRKVGQSFYTRDEN